MLAHDGGVLGSPSMHGPPGGRWLLLQTTRVWTLLDKGVVIFLWYFCAACVAWLGQLNGFVDVYGWGPGDDAAR